MDNQDLQGLLSKEELETALELANITSGAASSTFSMLIDQNLELGKPQIAEFKSAQEFLAKQEEIVNKSVLTVIRFQNDIQIPIGYILDLQSAIRIANIMMGGATGEEDESISDIQLSAIGEAISQMMGAVANNMSQILSHQVDITAPEVAVFSVDKMLSLIPELSKDSIITLKYKLSGSSVIPDCELLQITSLQGLRHQIEMYHSTASAEVPAVVANQQEDNAPVKKSQAAGVDKNAEIDEIIKSMAQEPQKAAPVAAGAGAKYSSATPQWESAAASSPRGEESSGFQGGVRQTPQRPVTVQPVEFPSFDSHIPAQGAMNKNLELVMDVCLNLTVELGRTELPIKEVLELTRGSVIELNRVAGESVDLFANGKMIAKGEVVVIEDNFGLRITSIVSPADRLRGL